MFLNDLGKSHCRKKMVAIRPLVKRRAEKKRIKKFIRHQSDRYVKLKVCKFLGFKVFIIFACNSLELKPILLQCQTIASSDENSLYFNVTKINSFYSGSVMGMFKFYFGFNHYYRIRLLDSFMEWIFYSQTGENQRVLITVSVEDTRDNT